MVRTYKKEDANNTLEYFEEKEAISFDRLLVQNQLEIPENLDKSLKELKLIELNKADLDALKKKYKISPTLLSRTGAVYIFRDKREEKKEVDMQFLHKRMDYFKKAPVWRKEPQDKTDILDRDKHKGDIAAKFLAALLPNEAELIQITAGRKEGGIIESKEPLFKEAAENGSIYLDISKIREIASGVSIDNSGANGYINNNPSAGFRR